MDVDHAESALPPRGIPVAVIGAKNDTKYRCSSCKYILRDPMQSYCGHRYCKKCIKYITREGTITCPSCISEQAVSDDSNLDMSKIFPDNATKRELSKLPAQCPNDGCSWTGILKDFESHERSCRYRVEHCICGGKFSPDDYPEHVTKDCPFRSVNCPHCGLFHKFNETEVHLSTCSKLPLTCPRCREDGIPREMMEEHLKKPECKPRVQCPYACGKLVEEHGIAAHVHTAPRQHLDAVFQSLSRMNARMDEGLNTLHQEILTRTERPHNEAGAVAGEEQMETSEGPELDEEGIKKDEVFERAIAVLTREVEKANKKTEELLSERRTYMDRIAVLERTVQGLSGPGSSPIMSLEDLPNFDGSLVWKIDNFAERREHALNGTHPGMTSAPFYTSKTGYKICGRVYLDGDGIGKGTHLSVFIVIMRGSYDSLLRWPFRQRVTMTLVDQGPKRKHVTDAFRPDPSSASFQRPRSDMNTASGCPMFIPLPEIIRPSVGPEEPQFLKDDSIFIKLHVDISNLSDI